MDNLDDILVDIRRAAYQLKKAFDYADSDEGSAAANAQDDIDYRRDYLDDSIARYLALRSIIRS